MEESTNQEINERLAKAIQTVVHQQIAENDPPETARTLERLMEEGFTESESYILIGKAVSREVAEILVLNQEINMPRYSAALEELPLPFAQPKNEQSDEEESDEE